MNPFRTLGVRASMALFSAVAIGAILGLAIAAFVNLRTSASTATQLVDAVGSTRVAGDLDMAHDAINSDVAQARLAGANASDTEKKALQDDLSKHIGILRDSMAELDKLTHDPAFKAALDKVKPDATAYTAGAQEIVSEVLKGATPEAKIKDFAARFHALEQSLGTVSDLSHAFARNTVAASQDNDSRSGLVLSVVVIASTGLTILFAALFSNTVLRRLGAEPVELRRVAQGIADNYLGNTIALQGDANSVGFSMVRMQDNLGSAVRRLLEVAQTIAQSSGEIADGNGDLAHRTELQASALEKTAAAMEQMNATVRQNADNARQANQLAQSASHVAVQGGEVVAQVVDTMKGINDASRKISDIISVIDGIAFQTNILALNAAVEAARAGEQGRGFAVVATEVRTLAGRSAEAAKEIKYLINASVERVEHGTSLVDRAGATMQDVVNSIRQVTEIVGAISVASAEQAAGASDIGSAVSQLDNSTQQNATLVEQMARSAMGLNDEAQRMVHIVGRFRFDSPS